MKCKKCGKKTRLPTHKFCSQRCHWDSKKELKGEKAPNYRKVVGKSQVHKWLDANYGKPKVCEGTDCRRNTTWYDWALKRGKAYERKRENFIRLCRSCHRRYDLTEERVKKITENIDWWTKGAKNPGKPWVKGERHPWHPIK